MHISLSLSNSSKTIFEEFIKFNLVQCMFSEYYKHKEFEMYNNILISNFVVWSFVERHSFRIVSGVKIGKLMRIKG